MNRNKKEKEKMKNQATTPRRSSESVTHHNCNLSSHRFAAAFRATQMIKSPSPSQHTRTTQAPKNAAPAVFGSFSMGHRGS